MSAPPSVPSGSAAAATEPAQTSEPRFSFERFAGWALPLVTIFLLLSAFEEAVRARQLKCASAGLAAYLVSLGMWLALKLLSRKLITAASPAAYPASPPAPEKPQPPSGWQFSKFGAWFFPSLAVTALVPANYLAARRGEQSWVVSGAITFLGCFLVWAGWLMRPFRQPFSTDKPNLPGISKQSFWPIEYSVFTSLLLLSLGVVIGAIAFAETGLRVRWLWVSLGSFVVYVTVLFNHFRQVTQLERIRNAVLETVAATVALAAFAATLGTATWLHRLSWMAAAVLGVCGCVALWLLQLRRSIPALAEPTVREPSYRSFPGVLLAALLALVGIAVYRGEVSALRGAGLAVLGGLTLWFSWMFVVSVHQEGPPEIESNWAGLGSGLGGWRFSASLIYALCALVLAVFTGSGLYQVLENGHQDNVTQPAKSSAATTTAANPAKPETVEPSSPSKPQ